MKEVIVMLDDLTYKKTTEIVTWVYDADFEFLNDESIKRIVVGGVRMHDYHLRLLLAGRSGGKDPLRRARDRRSGRA